MLSDSVVVDDGLILKCISSASALLSCATQL